MSKRKGFGEEALKLLKKLCWEHRIKMVWTRPMAKGTYQKLRELIPNEAISNKRLYAALCCHSRSPAYLKNLTTNAFRLAPGGVKEGKVTFEEAQFARTKVRSYKAPKRRGKYKPNAPKVHIKRRISSNGRK